MTGAFPLRRERRVTLRGTTRFSARRRAMRTGLTLLETMLAMSLAAMLLASIYFALEQSWKLASSGREEMERAQLARALVHRISLDVRAITFLPPPPEDATDSTNTTTTSSSSGGANASGSTQNSAGNSNASGNSGSTSSSSNQGTSGTSSSASSSSTGTATTTGPNSHSIGLRGSTNLLEMSVSRPRRDLLPASSAAVVLTNTSDLRQVTYSFTLPGAGTSSGLVRTEGDRMAVEVSEASGGTALQLSNAQALAPEISSIAFRYYDGRTWSITWDSDEMGRIPRAVEVTVTFVPPRRKPSVFGSTSSQSMNTFRSVINIPVSDPFPKEFAE